MNGNGFGFNRYPQRPSVQPQQVGNALAALGALKRAQAAPPTAAPTPGGPQFGAVPSSSFMQAPPAAGTPEGSPALKMAVAEALSRRNSGGDSRGQQGLPGNPFNIVQLARMGLSQPEIQLLQMSGGVR